MGCVCSSTARTNGRGRFRPTPAGATRSMSAFRRTVPVGQPLRLTAIAEIDGALPLGLSISADED